MESSPSVFRHFLVLQNRNYAGALGAWPNFGDIRASRCWWEGYMLLKVVICVWTVNSNKKKVLLDIENYNFLNGTERYFGVTGVALHQAQRWTTCGTIVLKQCLATTQIWQQWTPNVTNRTDCNSILAAKVMLHTNKIELQCRTSSTTLRLVKVKLGTVQKVVILNIQ